MDIRNAHIPLAFLASVGIGMVINVLIFPLTHALWSGTIHQGAVDSMVGAGWGEVLVWRVFDGAFAVVIMGGFGVVLGVIGVALIWAFFSFVIDYIGRNFVSRW